MGVILVENDEYNTRGIKQPALLQCGTKSARSSSIRWYAKRTRHDSTLNCGTIFALGKLHITDNIAISRINGLFARGGRALLQTLVGLKARLALMTDQFSAILLPLFARVRQHSIVSHGVSCRVGRFCYFKMHTPVGAVNQIESTVF